MHQFDPSTDPIILRLLSTLYEQPPAVFIYVQRRIFKRCPSILHQDLANLPFDQFAAQTEAQLAEHFSAQVTPIVVRFALHGLRRRLGMHPRTGIAPAGFAGKMTLIDSLGTPASDEYARQLMFADFRIEQAWEKLPESDAVFLKFFRKNEELLLSLLRVWTQGKDEPLVRDLSGSTWQAALLLFDPTREWTFKFIERIAYNLLRDEWTRRRKWKEVFYLEGLRDGDDDEQPWSNTELPARPPIGTPLAGLEAPAEAEPAWIHQWSAWGAALRAIMTAPCLPLHRAVFIATTLLDHTPASLVRQHAQTLVADFVSVLEAEFAWRSNLTDELVSELFKPLRQDLARTVAQTAHDGRYRKSHARILNRLVGTTRIGIHFRSRDVTQQAGEISRWSENAKRHVWALAQRNGTSLFRELREVQPGWNSPRRSRRGRHPGVKGRARQKLKSQRKAPAVRPGHRGGRIL